MKRRTQVSQDMRDENGGQPAVTGNREKEQNVTLTAADRKKKKRKHKKMLLNSYNII